MFLFVPGFQRQVFKHVNILSEGSKEMKEQKKNKGSVLCCEIRLQCIKFTVWARNVHNTIVFFFNQSGNFFVTWVATVANFVFGKVT